MKNTITKLALTGALVATGFGVGTLADVPVPGLESQQASAAFYADDYYGLNYKTSGVASLPQDAYMLNHPNYMVNYGETIKFVTPYNLGDTFVHSKVYLVKKDGTMQRYKTVTAPTISGGKFQAEFLFNTVYPAGQYIMVTTIKTSSGHLYQITSGDFTVGTDKWNSGAAG